MVDIRELARRSGVSVATVSRALNDRADVSPATRQRIVELARELGYSPNQPARALVRRQSDIVGLIWDTGYEAQGRHHPFLQDLLTGLKRPLSDAGYHLMLLSTAAADGHPDAYLRVARQHHLAGVIMMGVDQRHPAIGRLVDSAVPCVGVDLAVRGPRAAYVTSDNRAGAAIAVAHLASLGHRRIATITGPLDLMPATERLDGYRSALAAAGLSERPEYIEHGDFFLASGYDRMRRLLELAEPPTAVFVAGDEMAIGAMHAIGDAGRSVPGDVAIVGFDDIEPAILVRPALTTIAQDRQLMSRSAVRMLVDSIGDESPTGPGTTDGTPRPQVVATKLVVRASCGAPGPGPQMP